MGQESGERVPGGLVLGIETSCDETAAAVVRGGRVILSNVVATQIELHAAYGGVVPELASREHLRNIVPVVQAALAEAGVRADELDAVAVTAGPGLAGALLVGILYAKAFAFGLGRPLIAVNHLEGHVYAVLMDGGRAIEGPVLALVVSGGHTHLYLARAGADGVMQYENVGRTVDDAAGEAYDKVAKLLGLGYPGGPWMDGLAAAGDAGAVGFHFGQIKPREDEKDEVRFDFSFSGIKTAVLRYVKAQGMEAGSERRRVVLGVGMTPAEALERFRGTLLDAEVLDLIASFQGAVVGNLMRQTFAAAAHFGVKHLVVSGGVAANRELRRRFRAEAEARGMTIGFPGAGLSTDNAAMIAAAAWPRLMAGESAGESVAAQPQLRLG